MATVLFYSFEEAEQLGDGLLRTLLHTPHQQSPYRELKLQEAKWERKYAASKICASWCL